MQAQHTCLSNRDLREQQQQQQPSMSGPIPLRPYVTKQPTVALSTRAASAACHQHDILDRQLRTANALVSGQL